MQKLLDDFHTYCAQLHLHVNIEKSEYIIFNNKNEVEEYPFQYNNINI